MEYIRTKDGKIYNKSKIICSAFREEYCSPNWNEDIEKYLQTKIVAEADTIEELCDEYVCVMPSGETFLLDKNTDLKAQVNYVGDVYGSIWIDGDLHKVAKVNKEGELELL